MTNDSDISKEHAILSRSIKLHPKIDSLNRLDLFLTSINQEIHHIIQNKLVDEAYKRKELRCYRYILAKHRTLTLRKLAARMKNAASDNDKLVLTTIQKKLKTDVENRFTLLNAELKGHPEQSELTKKLNENYQKAINNLNKTPDIITEIEGKLAFRLDYDSDSLFTQAAYDNLGTLYRQVLLNPDLSGDDLKSGAKSVASFMVNQSLLTGEKIANLEVSENNPVANYQAKLDQAKQEQYRILKRTFSDMTKRTQASYNKDLADDLINIFVPDSAAISKFKSTSFRTYGKDAIDLDLHRVFVLMMETDTEDDLALNILNQLQGKYFSQKFNELSPECAEANIKNFLNELVASLADILNEQMEAGGGFKKPLLTKHLNNLLKKYNHPYRIKKQKVSAKGEPSVFRLTMTEQTRLTAQEHFEKKILKPRIGLMAIFVDILLGLGAGALTTAAFLLLPFALAILSTVLIAGFIGVCSTFVNYRLYHRFFKPFIIRVATKGLMDALFGAKAPLNELKTQFNKMGLTAKIVSVLATLFIVGPLLATLVIGFSAIVSIATMVSVVTTAMTVVAGFPLLIIGAALMAATIAVIAFIVHLPLILIVTVDLFLCIKGLAETVINVIRGEKGDALSARILRGLVVVPLVIAMGLLVLPLVAATILTVKDFKQATISFGNLLRKVCHAPKRTILATIGAITSFPGLLIMAVGGLVQASAKGLRTLKSKLFAKKERSEDASPHQEESGVAKSGAKNPWISSFHRRLGYVKDFFKVVTLVGNGAGNGLIASDAAPTKQTGFAVLIIASFSSICCCALGFFGWNKAKVGEKGSMIKMDSTYCKLDKKLKKAHRSQDGGEDGQIQSELDQEISRADDLKRVKLPQDITAECHAFFEKRQKPAVKPVVDEKAVESLISRHETTAIAA
ncbi:MAG: sulfite exporter TauE/SafE family protein [Legionellales bacterium]|nr:sulfite exporter TauE/SafE family protein [Legionellales bacterium]